MVKTILAVYYLGISLFIQADFVHSCWMGVVLLDDYTGPSSKISPDRLQIFADGQQLPQHQSYLMTYTFVPENTRVIGLKLLMMRSYAEAGFLVNSNFGLHSQGAGSSQVWRCTATNYTTINNTDLQAASQANYFQNGQNELWPTAAIVTENIAEIIARRTWPPVPGITWSVDSNWLWSQNLSSSPILCRVDLSGLDLCPPDLEESYVQCSKLNGQLVDSNQYCLRTVSTVKRNFEESPLTWEGAKRESESAANNANLGKSSSVILERAVESSMRALNVSRAWIGGRYYESSHNVPSAWKWTESCCPPVRDNYELEYQGCYTFPFGEVGSMVSNVDKLASCRNRCQSSSGIQYVALRTVNANNSECFCLKNIDTNPVNGTAYANCFSADEDFSMYWRIYSLAEGGSSEWDQFEPNSYGINSESHNYFCGAINVSSSKLVDEDCGAKFPYLCEYDSSRPGFQCGSVDSIANGLVCYKLFRNDTKSWFSSHRACWDDGGRIASLYDKAFYTAVTRWLGTLDISSPFRVWVGVARDYFKWSEDNETISFFNFAESEPVSGSQSCLFVDSMSGYKWRTGACSTEDVDGYILGIRDDNAAPPASETTSPSSGSGGSDSPGSVNSTDENPDGGPGQIGGEEDGGKRKKRNKGLIAGLTIMFIVLGLGFAGGIGYYFRVVQQASYGPPPDVPEHQVSQNNGNSHPADATSGGTRTGPSNSPGNRGAGILSGAAVDPGPSRSETRL